MEISALKKLLTVLKLGACVLHNIWPKLSKKEIQIFWEGRTVTYSGAQVTPFAHSREHTKHKDLLLRRLCHIHNVLAKPFSFLPSDQISFALMSQVLLPKE